MARLILDWVWGVLTVWLEARGESFKGKVAVAEVILKRTSMKYFSDGTVAGTCLRDRQFSGWNNTDPGRIKAVKLDDSDPVAKECIEAWNEATQGSNLTGQAVHYYNPKVCTPDWAKGAEIVATIGNHLFVIPKEVGT